MERIVVGTDLSARAGGAVSYAAGLAAREGAALHLVSVVTLPLASADAVMPTAAAHDVVATSTTEIQRQLEAEARRLRGEGLEVEVHVCTGSPADLLCKVAETVGADLIVVGNHRMQGVGRLLGSVASKVAHHAPCSVLIARTG